MPIHVYEDTVGYASVCAAMRDTQQPVNSGLHVTRVLPRTSKQAAI